MLEGLARLGEVGTRVIEQSAENTVADLQLLQPILTQLAAAGPDLAGSLPLLLTYPFPDSSLTALNYRKAQTGGYAPLHQHDRHREPRPDRAALPVRDRPSTGALVEVPLEPADTPERVRPGGQPAGGQPAAGPGGRGRRRRAGSAGFTVPGLSGGHRAAAAAPGATGRAARRSRRSRR